MLKLNLIKNSYLKNWIKLGFSFSIIAFTACTNEQKAIMRGGIKTVNTIKNAKNLTKESVKEEIMNNTKKAIENIGR